MRVLQAVGFRALPFRALDLGLSIGFGQRSGRGRTSAFSGTLNPKP